MSWGHRADNIRTRDWSDLLDLWADFGTGFDTSQYLQSSLEQTIEATVAESELAGNNVNFREFDQRTPFVSELVFSQVKANHAFMCAAQRITSGNATWGVTDAYHASMLLMRSILAAFGIFVCRIHERSVIVDTFPWLGRVDDQKRFKKKHRNWKKNAAIISCTSKNLEQADLYALFQRVLNISTVPTNVWPEVLVQNILKTQKLHFSLSRNQLMYGSRFWFNLDDLLGECLSLHWVNQAQKSVIAYAFAKPEAATEMDCYCDSWVLFLMSSKLHEAIYSSFVDSLGIFAYMADRGLDLAMIERQFYDRF
jgi:hypothetical protein